MRLPTIVDRAAEVFGLSRIEIRGASRARYVARGRFAAAWVATKRTPCAAKEIGRELGNRDRTTVMNAVEQAEKLRAADPEFRLKTDRLLHLCRKRVRPLG